MARLVSDVKLAWRGLRREPTFALTAIVTLALGMATLKEERISGPCVSRASL